ncbi:MAG: hypothetical protein Q8P00_04200 [Dehalococcoidia bacterium]|nr:hypothetical protein [Dehalococcoidia bacterium]
MDVNSTLSSLSADAKRQAWTNRPSGFAVATPSSVSAYPEVPSNYEEVAGAIQDLLTRIGEPSVGYDLPYAYRSFPLGPLDGTSFVAAYAFPVELRSPGGKVLAQAKWIVIEWGRTGQPNPLFYSSVPYSPERVFELIGDVTQLEKAIR